MTELWARLRAVWQNLSGRERLLLSAGAIAFAVMLFFFAGIRPVVALNDRAAQRVEAAEQQLLMMNRLRREYESIDSRLASVEQRIRDNRDKQNTLTLLETLATNSAVKIDSMEERKSPDHDVYRETRVEVALKNVSLTQIVSFLHSIESSTRQFSIKGLRVKTRQDKSDLLDVNFTGSSFEVI